MKKIILASLVATFFSFNVQASSIEGNWCDFQLDFTTAYDIEADGSFKEYSLGATSGEMHGYNAGYISLGASEHHIYYNVLNFRAVDNVDGHLEEAKIQKDFLGRKKLIMTFDDGRQREYKPCRISPAQ